MRLFTRAARRAGLAMAYSAGYNPRPHLALVSPRPVGISCSGDLLVLTLEDDLSTRQVCLRLADQLPEGVNLTEAVDLNTTRFPVVQDVTYCLRLSEPQPQGLAQKIDRVLKSDHLEIERASHKDPQPRRLDIRPYLGRIDLSGQQLSFTLVNTDTGSAKPAEVLALLDLDNPYNRSQLVRSSLRCSNLGSNATVKQT